MKPLRTALLSLALLAVLPAAAQARTVALDGHVIAPPSASKGTVQVPVLLAPKSERKLKLRTGLVRARLPRNRRLSTPGGGRTLPAALRVGDRLNGKVKLSKKATKKLRKRALPTLKAKKARVTKRASALSVDELAKLVKQLQAQLAALSLRTDNLTKFVLAGFDSLSSELLALRGQMNGLEALIGNLNLSITTLQEALEALTGIVDPVVLTNLLADIQSLLGRVDALEGVTASINTTLSSLSTTVAGLSGELAALQSTVAGLTATVTGLGDEVDSIVGQLPGLLGQLSSLDTSLTALDGRLGLAEGGIDGLGTTVSGLTGSVTGLTGTVTGLTGQVDGIDTDLTALSSTVTGLTGDLALLQTDLGSLESTVAGLSGTVSSLSGNVSALQGTVGLICALPIIPC